MGACANEEGNYIHKFEYQFRATCSVISGFMSHKNKTIVTIDFPNFHEISPAFCQLDYIHVEKNEKQRNLKRNQNRNNNIKVQLVAIMKPLKCSNSKLKTDPHIWYSTNGEKKFAECRVVWIGLV